MNKNSQINSKLLITSCNDNKLWYSGLIGQMVPNLGYYHPDEYKSRQPEGYINFVKREHCKVIYEDDKII
jgi:hypothetical protein